MSTKHDDKTCGGAAMCEICRVEVDALQDAYEALRVVSKNIKIANKRKRLPKLRRSV